MQTKNNSKSTKKSSKNQLFKDTIIISADEFKQKLPNLVESEIESNNQIFHDLFDENKIKIKNDFDRKHCKEFLTEKDKYLQTIDLDDSLPDEDENTEVLKRSPTTFTFGGH